jgi:hypothetical protein
MLTLMQRAMDGDATVMPRVRELLKDPGSVDTFGDLARLVQRMLRTRLFPRDLLYGEALARKLDQLRAELTEPGATPLERLLVERVVTCWLHLHHLELVYAVRQEMALEVGMYFQKCIDRAHKRYLSAVKALVVVRKLALPVLAQVNVTAKQVAVSKGESSPPAAPNGPERNGKPALVSAGKGTDA